MFFFAVTLSGGRSSQYLSLLAQALQGLVDLGKDITFSLSMNAGVVLEDFEVVKFARGVRVETADVVDALLPQLGPSPSFMTARPEPTSAVHECHIVERWTTRRSRLGLLLERTTGSRYYHRRRAVEPHASRIRAATVAAFSSKSSQDLDLH